MFHFIDFVFGFAGSYRVHDHFVQVPEIEGDFGEGVKVKVLSLLEASSKFMAVLNFGGAIF
jgi:hypothetical protein